MFCGPILENLIEDPESNETEYINEETELDIMRENKELDKKLLIEVATKCMRRLPSGYVTNRQLWSNRKLYDLLLQVYYIKFVL